MWVPNRIISTDLSTHPTPSINNGSSNPSAGGPPNIPSLPGPNIPMPDEPTKDNTVSPQTNVDNDDDNEDSFTGGDWDHAFDF
jgi:hypothetical protein